MLPNFVFIATILIYISSYSPLSCYKDKFDEFVNNKEVCKLVERYENGEIKTITKLHEALNDIGFKISRRTLDTYLKTLKVYIQQFFYYCVWISFCIALIYFLVFSVFPLK